MPERTDRRWSYGIVLLVGAVAGVLLLSALRFVGQPTEHGTHYHANWAIVIDGERLDLKADRYMEDVASCSADPNLQRPEDRVHMHEANHDVIHVHDSGATWGHLLANLVFGIGEDYLEVEDARFEEGDGRTLKFILNGRDVSSIRNLQIRDQDRLLISYGSESVDAVIAHQFPIVEASAGEFNVLPDPASCSGQAEPTLGERIRRAVWW